MPDETPAPAAPALGFSITANIHSTAQIVVQAFIERDDDPAKIDALIDKIMARLDRQAAKYLVKDLKKKLELEEIQFADQKKKADALPQHYAEEFLAGERQRPNGRQRPYVPTPQHQAALDNAKKSLEAMKHNIDRAKVNIAELEATAQ